MKTISLSLLRMLSLVLLVGCSAVPGAGERTNDIARVEQRGDADKMYIVDCLLPGQIRKLGSNMIFLTARLAIKTSAVDCEIRGGEYIAYDRANYATSLAVWLPKAQAGDPEAQTYTGEIYEKGLGVQPDYKSAADWYRKASAQGYSRAEINLGNLYEKGLGVEKNLSTAMEWYRKASGLEKKGLPYTSPIATSSDNKLVAEIQALKHELDNSRSQTKVLAEQLSKTQRQLKETQEKQQLFQNERDKTKSRLEDAQAKGNATESIRLEKIMAQKDNELAVLQQQISELNSQSQLKVNSLALSLEETEKRAKQLSDQLKSQQTATSDVQLKLVNAEARLAGTEKKLLEAQKSYSKVDANSFSQAANVNKSQDMQIKLAQSQALISQLQGEKQKLQQEINKINSVSARTIPRPSEEVNSSNDDIFATNIDFGKYYALIIGNQKYEKIPSLDTPDADARDVDKILREKYDFKTTLLINANRYQILTALNKLREQLTEDDNLLIYYAGHGVLDKVNKRGHWLPVDAELNSDANWISTVSITDILNAMSPRHILVVSDSCYSAALTRAAIPHLDAGMSQAKKTEWVKTLLMTKSRTALTSGGLKPVLDGGGDGHHSVFANAFIKELQNNNHFMEGQGLYRNVSADVVVATQRNGNEQVQVPEYAPIEHAGHEGGEFFFRPK
ncbi:MAG: caspase family protein [Methylococcales bacterium]|nr:caspase family protein [Methylococcales bacterium]MDD5632025.1 caspase family protein [Methylococcales bacterium]